MKLFLLLLFFCSFLHAEPIEFVVYGGVGGAADVASRELKKVIDNEITKEIAIVNKIGAAHNIAFQYISETKKPTIFLSDEVIITNKKTIGYPKNIIDEVKPIFYVGDARSILYVNADSNINSYEDFKNMKEIKIGYGGVGTQSEDAMEEFCENLNCLKVPYKSGSSGMVDLYTKIIDAYPMMSFGGNTFINNPKLRIIKKSKKKNWLILFSKNLSVEDEKTIINTLSKQNDVIFEELGIEHSKQNLFTIWNKALREN